MNMNIIMITSVFAIIIAFPTLGRSGPLPSNSATDEKRSALALVKTISDHIRLRAAFKGPDDKQYYFNAYQVYILSKNDIKEFLRNDVFPESPYFVDAMVYSPRTGIAYLFKDRKVWRYKYYENRFIFLQKKRLSRMVPNLIEAAFNYQNQIYLLKNDYLYVWDEQTNNVIPNHVFSTRYFWKDVPLDIDAALQFEDNKTIFWKWHPTYKMQYYLFDNKERTLLKKGSFKTLYRF